jgi:glutaredoxin
MASTAAPRQATLYRMVMEQHTCPYGLKAKDLLRRQGFTVEDKWLTSREATDAFKAEHGVKTTPQTFIDGARVGGYDDLRRYFAMPSTAHRSRPAPGSGSSPSAWPCWRS